MSEVEVRFFLTSCQDDIFYVSAPLEAQPTWPGGPPLGLAHGGAERTLLAHGAPTRRLFVKALF